MFSLFSSTKTGQFPKEVFNQKAAERVDVLLKTLARKLQSRTDKQSRKAQKIYLLFFVVFSTAICVYVIFSSLTEKSSYPLKISSIKVPEHSIEKTKVMTEGGSQKFKDFRKYFDSLNTTKAGKVMQDKIQPLIPAQ